MLTAIENQLKTEFNVKSVIEFAAIDKKASGRSTVLYVLPLGERVKNTEYTGATVSHVSYQVGVVTALRNVRDVQGGEHQQQLNVEREKIRALLAGWVPTPNHEPLARGNGRLMQFKNNTVYWLDIFETKNSEQAKHHQ